MDNIERSEVRSQVGDYLTMEVGMAVGAGAFSSFDVFLDHLQVSAGLIEGVNPHRVSDSHVAVLS
ncbi:MAG: hypothetical protein ACYCSN_14350 [Acidobacteriaceae bacterium]